MLIMNSFDETQRLTAAVVIRVVANVRAARITNDEPSAGSWRSATGGE